MWPSISCGKSEPNSENLGRFRDCDQFTFGVLIDARDDNKPSGSKA
jgi:hypothetical protein